jgi:hypothetical protein
MKRGHSSKVHTCSLLPSLCHSLTHSPTPSPSLHPSISSPDFLYCMVAIITPVLAGVVRSACSMDYITWSLFWPGRGGRPQLVHWPLAQQAGKVEHWVQRRTSVHFFVLNFATYYPFKTLGSDLGKKKNNFLKSRIGSDQQIYSPHILKFTFAQVQWRLWPIEATGESNLLHFGPFGLGLGLARG